MVRTLRPWLAVFLLSIAAAPAAAQQNLFNIPTGEITRPGELYFQHQFNFDRLSGSSNSIFDFGLGNGWEAGFNCFNLLMYDRSLPTIVKGPQSVEPQLLFNLQKGFDPVEDVWSVGVGGQFGLNPAEHARDVRFLNFTWAINRFVVGPPDDPLAELFAGGYYANTAYGGPGDRFGGLFGAVVPIVKDRFAFEFDCITGNRETSRLVVGADYTLPRGWEVSVGAQLPTPQSDVLPGIVVEFTIPGLPLTKR